MFKFIFLSIFLTTQAWSQGSDMIEQVIQDYFVGYQSAEVTLIKKAFHPNTRLLSVENGQLDVTEMESWLKNLEARQQRGDIREGKLTVESIDITNDAASVKLRIRFNGFEFIDYLSLLR